MRNLNSLGLDLFRQKLEALRGDINQIDLKIMYIINKNVILETNIICKELYNPTSLILETIKSCLHAEVDYIMETNLKQLWLTLLALFTVGFVGLCVIRVRQAEK